MLISRRRLRFCSHGSRPVVQVSLNRLDAWQRLQLGERLGQRRFCGDEANQFDKGDMVVRAHLQMAQRQAQPGVRGGVLCSAG